MKVSVLTYEGKKTGREANLSDTVFGIEPNDHAIYLDVRSIMANNRQGTHKAKQRNEISGSTKKIKRQKGTGTARAGSIKNPQFRGGGRIFGPQPRDYGFKLNKKVSVLARKSALAYKAREKNITVLEDFVFETPKTKNYTGMLSSLKFNEKKKTLLILTVSNRNIVLSGRNVPGVKIITAEQLNTYEVLNADQVIFLEGSVEKIHHLLENN